MVIPSKFQEHIEIMREFHSSFEEGGSLDKDFKEILKRSQNIEFGEAKEFLKTLSKEELKVIERYKNLSFHIDVNSLTEEGAANLLVENYQVLDYDGDGKAEVGETITESFLPQDMPNEMKRDIVEAFKLIPEDEKFVISLILNVEFSKHKKFSDISEESYVKEELLTPNYYDDVILELYESMKINVRAGKGEESTLMAFEVFTDEYLKRVNEHRTL